MLRYLRIAVIGIGVCAVAGRFAVPAGAQTIIHLDLGNDSGADIEFLEGMGGMGGPLSTIDDMNLATTGDQNTRINYIGFLEAVAADVAMADASVTLDGLTAVNPATVFNGTMVVQSFMGGTLSLYDPSNNLLLSGALNQSALSGPLGPPGDGGLFTTSFNMVTGGTLAPFIQPDSLTVAMHFDDVDGGAGLSVTPIPPVEPPLQASATLDPFTANATMDIEGVPEPASSALLVVGTALAIARVRRKKRV